MVARPLRDGALVPSTTVRCGIAQPREGELLSVSMLGALPPWRAVAPYTAQLVAALEERDEVQLEFLDFASLYPRWLYPGGDPRDPGGRRPAFERVAVRRLLAWYNPLSWLWAGLTARGQVLHAQWWSYTLAPVYLTALKLARLRGKRVVLTLHNVDPHEGGPWRRRLFRSVFGLADHFIVHSRANAEALCAVHPDAEFKASVVPLGLHGASRSGLTRTAARRALGLPQRARVILAFGNIRPYKGLDVLLRALRRLVDEGQEAMLLIAGDPWDGFEGYRQLIEELGLAAQTHTWLDFVPEERVEVFFQAADVAVYPYTRFDAQSAAATLALSFGLPLIVSNVGGLPDLVSDERCVVPAGDPAALARALKAVLADDVLREKLADDARRTGRELSWSEIAAKTTDVYRRVQRDESAGGTRRGRGIAA